MRVAGNHSAGGAAPGKLRGNSLVDFVIVPQVVRGWGQTGSPVLPPIIARPLVWVPGCRIGIGPWLCLDFVSLASDREHRNAPPVPHEQRLKLVANGSCARRDTPSRGDIPLVGLPRAPLTKNCARSPPAPVHELEIGGGQFMAATPMPEPRSRPAADLAAIAASSCAWTTETARFGSSEHPHPCRRTRSPLRLLSPTRSVARSTATPGRSTCADPQHPAKGTSTCVALWTAHPLFGRQWAPRPCRSPLDRRRPEANWRGAARGSTRHWQITSVA
jgi:hypothetical protein